MDYWFVIDHAHDTGNEYYIVPIQKWPIGPTSAFYWEVVMPDLTCIFCGGHAELHGR